MWNLANVAESTHRPAAIKMDAAASEPVTFRLVADNTEVNAQPMTFQDAYVQYAGDVYRFAHWLTGNPDDARDITSETFVLAFTGGVEPRMETVKAYLFAIARNLHRKQWRRAGRQEPLNDALPAPALAPDEAAAGRDDLCRTMAAVRALPELDRTVLLLRAEEGLAYEEIAALTGLSPTAAKVRVFRARAKLAGLLQPETGDSL